VRQKIFGDEPAGCGVPPTQTANVFLLFLRWDVLNLER
jgi:hypothetical protein